MENSFSEKTQKLWKKIGTHGIMTLATCAENRVTSRAMSVIVYGGNFYCQTGTDNALYCNPTFLNAYWF